MPTDRSYLLALDFGGTKHSAALLPLDGKEWLARDRVQMPRGSDAHQDQQTMEGMACRLVDAWPGRIAAIGVSFGGPVDFESGTVKLSHHVPGWEDIPLALRLADRFGARTVVDNDANAAALGEWRFGAGQGSESLLYVTVSTGIGGGWVLGSHVYRGSDGMAGEIGHMVVHPEGAPCDCGKKGCLEAEACGLAIARKALHRLAESRCASSLREKCGGDLARITAAMVAEAAQENDLFSCRLIAEAAEFLGQGLAFAVNLMNPNCIVLGGGVTKAGPEYWKTIRQSVESRILPQMRADIRPAALGDDAPLWGAAALAQKIL